MWEEGALHVSQQISQKEKLKLYHYQISVLTLFSSSGVHSLPLGVTPFPSRRNCYFYGCLRRIDWRDLQHGDRFIFVAVAIAPSVCTFRFGMGNQIEYFYRAMPSNFVFKSFHDRHRFDVPRIAAMRLANRFLEEWNVFHVDFPTGKDSKPLPSN